MIKAYFKLGRPINALAGIIAVFISAYVAGPETWQPVIMAALSVLLITVSTNAWNDYLDIEIDRINKPGRPLPSGQINPRGALVFSTAGTILSLLAATFINPPAFLIALGSNILLYFYSWKLKCTVLLGNITVALIIALCFIFGGVAAESIRPVLPLAGTVFFAMLAREILKTMADYRGDLNHNCSTIATRWGKSLSRVFVLIFLAAASLAMVAVFFLGQYSPVYLLVVAVGVYPIFTYIALNAESSATGPELERLSTLMKYCFFTWFLAVGLGAGLAA